MSLFENFPYTNLQQLNLDWIIEQLNNISSSSVISVNGQTGVVTLYQNAEVAFPNVPEDHWSMIRMADGTLRGIMFGNDDKAYIVHGNLLSDIYSQNNQPPYPVRSVNGKFGDVVLYAEQYVQLPTLTDAQIHNWTIWRTLNNVARGIQFEDDGSASIIDGQNRYVIYTTNNPPPYPVNSVNGQTGTIILFTDTNGSITYPAISDPDLEAWSIDRNVNGTALGLKIDENGYITLKVGAAEYTVYTSNDPQEGYVTDPEDIVQQVTEDSSADYWGLMRNTSEGSIGLLFENSDPDNPTAYIAYVDSNDQQQTLKILTPADIPATGVISVNAKTGIVILYGSDIELTSGDSRTIDTAINDAEEKIAFVENTNISTHTYVTGQYLIWNNGLYKATTGIDIGDTLSLSNLDPVTNISDILTAINTNITSLQNNKADYFGPGTYSFRYRTICPGFLTSASQNIHFYYPIRLKSSSYTVSQINITSITCRGDAGYIFYQVSDLSAYTITGTVDSNGVHFVIASSTSLGTNNSNVTVTELNGTFRIS